MAPPAERPATNTCCRSRWNSDMISCVIPAMIEGSPELAHLIGGIEPVPAGRGVGGAGLSGISDQQAVSLGDGVHVRAGREVVRVLLAAMQHDDEAARPIGRRSGNVELVASRSGRAGEGPGQELCAIRNWRRPARSQQSVRSHAGQRADRAGLQPAFAQEPQERRQAAFVCVRRVEGRLLPARFRR